MRVRIDYPFLAEFEYRDPGSNSRELRTRALQDYLMNCGMEISGDAEGYQVISFRGEENGEYWQVKQGH